MDDKSLRDHLLYLLGGGGAHISFETLVADFPTELMNRRVEHIPYTAWQVVEHMRIAQWDILEFIRNPEHVSPEFPAGYWADRLDCSRRADVGRNRRGISRRPQRDRTHHRRFGD